MTNGEVFIVEDNRPLADLYAEWLRDSYAVQTAHTGRDALDALDDHVDVVLLDRRLPDVSGDEILEEIRNRELDCRVAMVTAVEPNFDVVTMGFDDYLTKPISRDELQETVDTLLTRTDYDDLLQEYFAVLSMQSALTEDVIRSGLESSPGEGNWGRHGEEAETTPDEIAMRQVDAHVLPAVIADLADEYETKLDHRDRFLLKWLHVVFPFFTLSSVDDAHADQCRADKTLASMFVILLDDIGERHRDEATLAEVAKLPFPHESVDRGASDVDVEYVDVAESVWETLESRFRQAPRYDEIEPVFRYDFRQVIHAIRYSALMTERPEIANMTEARAIGAHNMMMLAYADIDLAYSPGFPLPELGALRSLIMELQQMARIGNWITTWERELEEGDVSAGVFVSAVENDIISPEELRNVSDDPALQERIREELEHVQVEEALLEQWHQRYEQLRADPPTIESIDVDGLLDGMERVMAYHLASRGLK